MMRLLYILLLTFLFTFCSSNKDKKDEVDFPPPLSGQVEQDTLGAEKDVSTNPVETLNSETESSSPFVDSPDERSDGYNNAIEPATFLMSTNIYADRNAAGEIIGTVGFNTPIRITGTDISRSNDLLEISWNSQKGFIKRDHIALHTFTKKVKYGQFKYFVKSYTDEELKAKNQNAKTYFSAAIYKYDLINHVLIDTFEIEHASIVREINSKNWRNVDIMLYTEDIGACCGCSSNQQYILDANNKFEIMFETSQVIAEDDEDDIEEYNTRVFLPSNPQLDLVKFYQARGTKYYSWNGIKLEFIREETSPRIHTGTKKIPK